MRVEAGVRVILIAAAIIPQISHRIRTSHLYQVTLISTKDSISDIKETVLRSLSSVLFSSIVSPVNRLVIKGLVAINLLY